MHGVVWFKWLILKGKQEEEKEEENEINLIILLDAVETELIRTKSDNIRSHKSCTE
jgi:hypothetical protein